MTWRGFRRVAVPAAALVVVLAAGTAVRSSASSKAERAAGASVVQVDLKAARQRIDGFGSSSRVWSDPHLSKSPKTDVPAAARAQILTLLYRRLGLTRSRQVLENSITPGPGGPYNFAGKRGADHVAFVKQARAFGLRTVFPGPVYLEEWMKADDPGGYVTYAMTILRYWRNHGFEPPLYAPMNEPQIAGDFPPKWMHDVVLMLGLKLRSEGFKTKLVVPDDENPGDAYRRAVAVVSDPAARRYVGALAYHIYKGDVSEMVRMKQLAAQYRLPVWMTEYSNTGFGSWQDSLDWAVKMQTVLGDGGVSAVDYLWGFFGSWVSTDTMVSIDFDNGVYRGYSLTPIYWITGQFSRFVRPGYHRVGSTLRTGHLLTTAYRGEGRVVVVAVNTSEGNEDVRIQFSGGRVRGPVAVIRSSERDHWRSLDPVRTSGTSLQASLAPRSVTTFVAKG